MERGPGVRPGGEARPPRPLSFPRPPPICSPDGDWQMQVLPGAPGTARQGRTRIIVSTNDGGVATQPRAPGHERPLTAQRAARHGRLSAALRAPDADVPLAITARAPGQHRLRANGDRHRRLAGRPTPAAPGGLAPRPCQSPHPDLPTLPPHRLVIPAPTEIRACAHQRRRGATCCARPPAARGGHRGTNHPSRSSPHPANPDPDNIHPLSTK